MNILKSKWYSFFICEGAKPMVFAILICLGLSFYLGGLTPKLISNLSFNYGTSQLFYFSLTALFWNFFIVYLNRVIYQILINKYVRMLILNARTKTYNRWLSAHDVDSEKYPQGEVISRVMSDSEAIRDLITSGAFGVFIDLAFVISCLLGFISLHKFTGIFIALVEVVATLLLFLGSRLMREMFMGLRNSNAKVNRVTANVIGGFRDLYYTRNDRYASLKTEVIFFDFLKRQNSVNTMDALYYALAESLYPILLALIIFIFPYAHLIEVALIFAIVDLIQRSIGPIKEISSKMANIQRAATGIDRIMHFLNELPPIPLVEVEKKIIPDSFLKMKVDLDYFEYPQKGENHFYLKDIHFEGKKGELIGIVGSSGSGKSTLLNILAGNLKNLSSEIVLFFSKDSNQNEDFQLSIEKLDEYQKKVSIVSQDSHIFSENLQFNISLNKTSEDDFLKSWNFFEENIPYLKAWGLRPNDMIVPALLSSGQRQLLAGIRACYLKKNIVLFDEISGALDSNLEFSLRKLIQIIQKQSLIIIVAHRVETILEANTILVMQKGRVIESGPHLELLDKSMTYQNFIRELSHS